MTRCGSESCFQQRYGLHGEIRKILATSRFRYWLTVRGNAIYLAERDCSMQRRHQKVVEEAPAPALPLELRRFTSANVAPKACVDIGYRVRVLSEFLFENGEFYFIRMNTRIQVEHRLLK